jgi:two-component SAPR family response regulator
MKHDKVHYYFLNNRSCFSWIFLLGFYLLCTTTSYSQEYGLEFVGAKTTKDKRTKLDLNPEGYFSFDDEFELTFKLSLLETIPASFGYVVRIIDEDNKNIDVVYDGPGSRSLKIIYGQEFTGISVPDDYMVGDDKWKELRLKINLNKGFLKLYAADTSYIYSKISFNGGVKILFGRNNFATAKTTDVPAMCIKDIRIFHEGKCKHYFPLNEREGNFATDLVSRKKKASVQYPIWIKPKYYDWENVFTTYLDGFAAITYNPRDEEVFMVGNKQMKIFSITNDSTLTTLDYNIEFAGLNRGSQLFFDTIKNALYCYNLMFRTVYYFNFSDLKWDRISEGPRGLTPIWFHNKYYSSIDSTLYIFGGYGQHKYYKHIQQYEFKDNKWDTLKAEGELFHPRMHAAMGIYRDTIYILGGFGSTTGDQILNPHHYTDLMAYSLKDNTFIKKYHFKSTLEDLDFGHSMVFDKNDQSYYVLATTIFEYESYLQLLKGNLNSPELKLMGNKIPYIFHNERSYADLFYSRISNKLIAVKMFVDPERNETDISVYTISFPPHFTDIEITDSDGLPAKLFMIIIVAVVILFLIIIRLRNNRRKGSAARFAKSGSKENELNSEGIESEVENSAQQYISDKSRTIPANSILFFGGFQIINKHGDDITKKFTPLLKELFLLIFLYSLKDKGISVERLTELLWFSMDANSAKNNRAVNIAKLKNILPEIESCSLNRKTGYWRIEFDQSIVYNDYWSCLKIINNQQSLSNEELNDFLKIASKGPLLGSANYEWLDEIKLQCSNLIIDTLMHSADLGKIENDPELMIKMADTILIFDILHDEAISMKCKALIVLGKHSIAKETFAKFTKEYLASYAEPYNKSFSDILNK